MKLMIELVPLSCVKNTLQNRIRAQEWERLSKQVEKQQGKRCGICGKASTKRKKLSIQEVWEYSELERVQKLKGLLALCSRCHSTKNIEQARLEAQRGDLDIQSVAEHFCRVNACSPDVFRIHVGEALTRWKKQSRQKWTTDLGEYAHLVEASKKPERDEAPRLCQKKERPSLVKAAIQHKTRVTGYIRRRKKKERAKNRVGRKV